MNLYEKMFGKPQTPKAQLERQLEKFKKPEERRQPPPVIPPALKKAGKAAYERFKEASIRMAEEERKHKPKAASKGIFEAFKEASVRAYQQHGTPVMSDIMSPATIRRMTPKAGRYKKQRTPKVDKYKKIYQSPKLGGIVQKRETEAERRTRERRQYDVLLKKGYLPSVALRKIESERK